jgi:murein DD-endopeptidase MepM/ murein hydrolase activator NlpD
MMRCNNSQFLSFILAPVFLMLAVPCDAGPALAFPTGGYVYPLVSPRLSSDYGNRKHPLYRVVRHHNGIDLAAPEDTPIRAVKGGVVVFADPYKGYGNLIVIKHSEALTSHYGHCKEFSVKPGQRIKPGQIIGTVGKTGNVTGPHLHLELRMDGKPVDPEKIIPDLDGSGEG